MNSFLILLVAISISAYIQLSQGANFLPFGFDEGDVSTDGSAQGPINLATPLVYYSRKEEQLYLSSTGVIFFRQEINTNMDATDLDDLSSSTTPLIAPQWATQLEGTFYYRVSQNQSLLGSAKELLTDQNTELSIFHPFLVVILTLQSQEMGTLQVVLTTDGTVSFASFIYNRTETIGARAYAKTVAFTSGSEFRSIIASGYGDSGESDITANTFRIDGFCVSAISPDDICHPPSYTIDCHAGITSSTICSCPPANDTTTSTASVCVPGSMPVGNECYFVVLPCDISEDCPVDCTSSEFMPSGFGVGDSILIGDDLTTDVVLTVPVVYYNTQYTTLYVSTNGLLSFQSAFDSYTPCTFPCTSIPIIAPLWTDLNINITGYVLHRTADDAATLEQVAEMISDINPKLDGFTPTLAVIITWLVAAPHASSVLEGNETFQVIISTNGQMSFATFIYDSPTSVTSKINVPNSPLSVGFDSGDNANATSYDASCAILEVVNVFQIDGSSVTKVCQVGAVASECGGTTCQCMSGQQDSQSTCDVGSLSIAPIVGGAVSGVILLVLIVAFALCIYVYRKRRRGQRRGPSIMRAKSEGLPVQRHDYEYHFGGKPMRLDSTSALEVSKSLLMIKSSNLQLGTTVGQGEFGIVYKAQLREGSSKGYSQTVAVKTLKGFLQEKGVEDLLKECIKMREFDHPNVLTLQGVCLDGGPAPYIVMPFMTNGSLLSHLKENRGSLIMIPSSADLDDVPNVQKKLLDMCLQVAKGMEYLASKRVVHRDLAARNCMIDGNFVIKVSDFGLSESIDATKDYFRQDQTEVIKLPIKWMALESISDAVFSEKTDVWGYGVTCWEVFSGGKAPYAGAHPLKLREHLETGYRLEKPSNLACTDEMYDMMNCCWEEQSQDRPTFSELSIKLSEILGSMAEYLTFGSCPS